MSGNEVTVIDYGVGNLLSVQKGFEYCGAKVSLTSDPVKIMEAERVVLPGVGAFSNAMSALEKLNLVAVIRELACRQTPLLGICLGMQLLLDESVEFGITPGLGIIPGRVIPVPTYNISGVKQKIPHIGWNSLKLSKECYGWSSTLLQNIRPGDEMYFVHSYMAEPTNDVNRLADCEYGGILVSAVIRQGQTTGCQFHPEKSGEMGLQILRQFILQ